MRGALLGAVVAGAALSGVLAWELTGLLEQTAGEELAAPAPESPVPVATVGSDGAVQPWAASVLDRPLFRKDRRAETVPAGQDPRAEPMPRLTGIVISPLGKRAIFKLAENSKSLVAEEGAHVGAFLVRSIEPGRAVMSINGSIQVLTPSIVDAKSTRK